MVFSGVSLSEKSLESDEMRRVFNPAIYWSISIVRINPDVHQDTKSLFIIKPFYLLGGER